MKVVIAAAGTGGHINPGIAIANKIIKEEPRSEIIFIGTNRGLEKDLTSRAGYKLKTIDAYGFSKKITVENIKKTIKTIQGFKQARTILEEFEPDIVIGMGGYICGAVISEAHKLRIPTMLHESNAYPGLAVRILQKKTDTIMVGFEEARKYLTKSKKIVYTGNPTKIKPMALSSNDKLKIKQYLGINNNLPLVLVFGGSQGAKAINDTIVKILKGHMNKNYQIVCSAGQEQYNVVAEELKRNGMDIEKLENAKILPYIYNMAEVMYSSDLVVARSGAMTLTELALLGKPAIFIPLPSSSANRQEENSRAFEKVGAAKVILNSELNENNLNDEINDIISDTNKIAKMGENSRKMAVYDVEDRIYQEIKNLLSNTKKQIKTKKKVNSIINGAER